MIGESVPKACGEVLKIDFPGCPRVSIAPDDLKVGAFGAT